MTKGDRFNPFPGLRAFDTDESHVFFGRERATDELRGRLGKRRFLTVVGGSGSGKSSLVRAGLIPSLQSGFMVRAGSSWRVANFRPGADPIGNLAVALNRPDTLGRTDDLAETNCAMLEATLRGSARGLADCVSLAGLPEPDNLLVVVDRFEELFRFHRSRMLTNARDDAVAFVKMLLEASRQPHVPVYVVLTLRADFIGECMLYPGLPEAINDGQYLVPRMSRDDLRAAITGPVAVGGGTITPRLVVRLLNEVGDDPDQLPLLQHALMRTWDYWAADQSGDEPIDTRHYAAIGTMARALSRNAEQAYQELIDRARIEASARDGARPFRRRAKTGALAVAATTAVVRKTFQALTDTTSDGRGLRRPTTVEEIRAICDTDIERVYEVAERFRQPGSAFLEPPADEPLHPDSVLDISHESLSRSWDRLREWAGEEREDAQLYHRLARDAQRWEEGTQGLWRNPELRLASRWRTKQHPTAAWAERYDPGFDRAMRFLDKSRHAHYRRAFAWSLLPLAIVAALFYAIGLRSGDATPVSPRAGGVRADDSALCRLAARDMALEAAQLTRPEARVAMACKAYDSTLNCRENPEPDHPAIYGALLWARDGIDPSGSIALDVPTCRDPLRARSAYPVRAVTFAHDGRTLVAGNEAGRVYVIDASTRERLAETQAFSGGVRALAWNPARDVLAAAGVDGRLHVWDVAAAARQRFSSASSDVDAGGPVTGLAFNGRGDRLAAAGGDGMLGLWTLGRGRTDPTDGVRFRAHDNRLTSIAFSPDGRHLAAGSPDGAIVWSVDGIRDGVPDARATRRFCSGLEITAVAFDDTILACGGADGYVGVVPIDSANGAARSLPGHTSGVNALSFGSGAAGATKLASASFDGSVRVWTRRDGEWDPLSIVLTGHERWVWDVELSPDGERLASSSEDRTVRLWESRSKGLADELCGSR